MDYKYMVVTRCFTFNHAPYIVDAMNGFTMQETTFPVITLIVDDASTDGEPEVIKQYLADHFKTPYRTEETDDYHLICANHNTNPNCTFVVFLLKYNHYSIKKAKFPYLAEWLDNAKYQALCEGDDYWIHPQKLEIQVGTLEEHPECVLSYTAFKVVDAKNNKTNNRYRPLVCYSGDVYDNLIKTNFVQTATILVRNKKFWKARNLMVQRKTKYDYSMFLELSLLGHFIYNSTITSAYRIVDESFSHSKSLKKEIRFAMELRDMNEIYYNVRHKPRGKMKQTLARLRLITIVTIKHYIKNIIHFNH